MAVEIKKVTTRGELRKFIRFNYEFYKDNPYSVPDLYDDNDEEIKAYLRGE